jgi:ABC-2 type transport system permease protein
MGIDARKIRLILKKEFLEMRQQRALVLGLLFLPLLFTFLPLGIIFVLGKAPADEVNGIGPLLQMAQFNPALRGLSEQETIQALIGQPISIMLFILPALLPSIIASYSIVGEKVSRTLEPVLATPVTTFELLLGKILSALIPAVAITWFFGAIFAVGMLFVTISHSVLAAIISPAWLVLILLCAPLLALVSISVTVAASSRANDPRSAQQISGLVILPVILVIVGQIGGLVALSPIFSLVAVAVLALLAILATWLATRVFQRESILTKWS